MDSQLLSKATVSLEDAFFLAEDKVLIEKLRQMEKMKHTMDEYAKVSGIQNPQVLKKFVELDLPVNVVACIAVVPLVEVAWADEVVDEEEKKMILENAPQLGIKKNSIEFELLERWLAHKPNGHLLTAWANYIQGMCEELKPEEKQEMQTEILKHVHDVANASGGILGTGIGNKISKKERAVIENLQRAFE
ncbi:MAG: TerB family tellurite resistance protein [Oligoflexia bacterium]|nr:TerB family tellurite resistance protein [Oligoflexia bacterium]MBF0364108.1 TerB family tellurite resistance protein [Oligoflexia bacterium]